MDLAFFVAAFGLLTVDIAYSADSCPALYERYCSKHSSCLPKSSCDIQGSGMTPEEKVLALQLQNKYRSMIALGVKDMPQAANMMELEWDEELAANSQKYADQCIYEHDLINCREVKNFQVGQNLGYQNVIGGFDLPPSYSQPNWEPAVADWYNEIRFFGKEDIYPMHPPKSEEEEIRHFTQLIWANTFRVGCGFVVYKTPNNENKLNLTRLYVCEYGPTGNTYGSRVYEEGDPCSNCPINSCCGETCKDGKSYPGLCKRTDDSPPQYPPPEPQLFYCSFQDQPDCDHDVTGAGEWKVEKALSGNYISIVLNGGETSTLSFKKRVQPTDPAAFCIEIEYRHGPNKDGDENANKAFVVLSIPEASYTYPQSLPDYPNPGRQMFAHYSLTASWTMSTELKLKFEVPADKPAQFFEVQSILVQDGNCKK